MMARTFPRNPWRILGVLLLILAAVGPAAAADPAPKVYVVLWFDTEDYLLPAAAFQGPRLFADDFEGGANAFAAEPVRDVQRRVVAGGEDVVFGVEPENDVDLRDIGTAGRGDEEEDDHNRKQESAHISHSSYPGSAW